MVLIWAALVLEIGLARRVRVGRIPAAALALPLVGLFVGISRTGAKPSEVAFLGRLVRTVGSPPQLTICGLLMFYSYAWLRGVRSAEGFVLASGLLAAGNRSARRSIGHRSAGQIRCCWRRLPELSLDWRFIAVQPGGRWRCAMLVFTSRRGSGVKPETQRHLVFGRSILRYWRSGRRIPF